MSACVYNVSESALLLVCSVVNVRGKFAWSIYVVVS